VRTVAGGLGPNEHAARIALVLGDVGFHPLDHPRNVFAAVVPILAGMALHGHHDHSVLHAPPADVVVKGIGFRDLLLRLVALPAGNVHQDRARAAAFIRGKNVN
jgi:hypothetical protein